jgi:demethylspheroidene O-methyltransferase
LERARGLRDRLLMSPGFQRWAAAFPVTRWIATRRERELFDRCAGFVYTQTLLACVRLQVFQLLADGPLTAAMVGTRVDLSPVMAERLLLAATALRLLERRGADRFGLALAVGLSRSWPAFLRQPLGWALRASARHRE